MAIKKYNEAEAREAKNARQRAYAKRTHFASNAKYNKENYTPITIRVRKDIADLYRETCDNLGITYSEIIHEAIAEFLAQPE